MKLIVLLLLFLVTRAKCEEEVTEAALINRWIAQKNLVSEVGLNDDKGVDVRRIKPHPLTLDQFIKLVKLDKNSIKGRYRVGMGETVLVRWSDTVDLYIVIVRNTGSVIIGQKTYKLEGSLRSIIPIKGVPKDDVGNFLKRNF